MFNRMVIVEGPGGGLGGYGDRRAGFKSVALLMEFPAKSTMAVKYKSKEERGPDKDTNGFWQVEVWSK